MTHVFLSDFVYVAADVFTKRDVLRMEQRIFQAIGFALSIPLPLQFIRRFRFFTMGKSPLAVSNPISTYFSPEDRAQPHEVHRGCGARDLLPRASQGLDGGGGLTLPSGAHPRIQHTASALQGRHANGRVGESSFREMAYVPILNLDAALARLQVRRTRSPAGRSGCEAIRSAGQVREGGGAAVLEDADEATGDAGEVRGKEAVVT